METYNAAEMTTFTCDYGMFITAAGTIATVLAHHDMFQTATVEPILTQLWHIMTFIPLLRLRPIPKLFYHIMTCLLLTRRGQCRYGSGTSWHVCYWNYGTDNRPALAHYELSTSWHVYSWYHRTDTETILWQHDMSPIGSTGPIAGRFCEFLLFSKGAHS